MATQAAAAPKAAKKIPAPAASSTNIEAVKTAHGFRRKMTGKVTSDKMDKTVVVECVSYKRDALYGKYLKSRARYKAHDERNEYKVGDQVEIQEHRPISREKRFIVTKLLKKSVQE